MKKFENVYRYENSENSWKELWKAVLNVYFKFARKAFRSSKPLWPNHSESVPVTRFGASRLHLPVIVCCANIAFFGDFFMDSGHLLRRCPVPGPEQGLAPNLTRNRRS
jgi:hypothetical protein